MSDGHFEALTQRLLAPLAVKKSLKSEDYIQCYVYVLVSDIVNFFGCPRLCNAKVRSNFVASTKH